MNKVVIFSDSTCDLSSELITAHDIQIVPLYITIGEKSYKDGVEITTLQMFEKVSNNEGFPKSSASTPVDFYLAFKPYVDQGYDIIYTGISAKMSSCLQNAKLAADEFDEEQRKHIYLVDSGELSTGIGLLLLKTCKWRDQGFPAGEIILKMEELIPHIRAQFVIDTLDYLHKGGRCSSLTQLFGTTFKIHPQIKVEDGRMIVGKKTMGSTARAIKFMVDEFLELFDDIDHEFVFITHCEAPESAAAICKQIAEVAPEIENFYETKAGVVISSHCGPGCIGILYIMR